MKSQSIACLLHGSEHIYWIWDLEGEVHSIWDLCASGLQKCKARIFSELGGRAAVFRAGAKKIGRVQRKFGQFSGGYRGAAPDSTCPPEKFVGGYLTSSICFVGQSLKVHK